jgi:hypothetical protein
VENPVERNHTGILTLAGQGRALDAASGLRPQPHVQPATSISEEGHTLLLLDQKANTLRIVAYLSRPL